MVFALAVAPRGVTAQASKACPKIGILSFKSEARSENHHVDNPSPETNVIATDPGGKTVTIAALGPILGSMDSADVRTQLRCTQAGVEITATLIRSQNYKGDTLQNQLWRPVITVLLRLSSARAVFTSTWQRQLTNGEELGRARTPPYPELVYPIRAERTLSAP